MEEEEEPTGKRVVTRYLLHTDLGVWSQQQGHQ
jgi:hypothetical protein